MTSCSSNVCPPHSTDRPTSRLSVAVRVKLFDDDQRDGDDDHADVDDHPAVGPPDEAPPTLAAGGQHDLAQRRADGRAGQPERHQRR